MHELFDDRFWATYIQSINLFSNVFFSHKGWLKTDIEFERCNLWSYISYILTKNTCNWIKGNDSCPPQSWDIHFITENQFHRRIFVQSDRRLIVRRFLFLILRTLINFKFQVPPTKCRCFIPNNTSHLICIWIFFHKLFSYNNIQLF